MRSIWLLLLAFLTVAPALARTADEPLYVLVSAQSIAGDMLTGVEFNLVQDGKVLGEMKTGANGAVRFTVPEVTDWQKASVVVDDPAWKALPPVRRLNRQKTTWTYIFRLYPSDAAAMDPAVRADYLLALPEIERGRRAEAGPLEPAPAKPSLAHLSAFLEGSRVELPATFERPTTTTLSVKNDPVLPSVSAQLLDGAGRPVAFRRVLLFGIKEGTNSVTIVASRNTNRQGLVAFGELQAGRVYRMEVPVAGDGMIARGPVFQAPQTATQLDPLVLRAPDSRLTGIATYDGEPVAGAEVIFAGDVVLTTRTNALGYFDLSPIPSGGGGEIVVRRPGTRDTATLPFRPGRTECIVPLEVVLPGRAD